MQIAHIADWGCHLWRPWSIAGQSRSQTWASKLGSGALVQMFVRFLCTAHAVVSPALSWATAKYARCFVTVDLAVQQAVRTLKRGGARASASHKPFLMLYSRP